ncbi:unnamed protein product [Heterobilharzia americana]|nr:unnamed protein product [Heterobilharzia americana]
MGQLHKLDNRIQIMLKNGIMQRHRSMFVMVGNKGQDQVPIMHQILNSLSNKGRLSLLWCYKKELSFSTHRKKNLKLLNKRRKAGLTSDATIFEQFVCSTDIRWCYYDESQKILGQTFDMCVLQDFEALTPNILARTIETVSGGGLVILLLKTMDSLNQLCTMVMDVHSRYRTESQHNVVGRFNERFLLSLASNSRCLVLDDRWNVLPLSRKVLNSLEPLPAETNESASTEQKELQKLKISLAEDGSPFAPLIKLCITFDQAKSLVQFCASLASNPQSENKSGTKSLPNCLPSNVAHSLLESIGATNKDVGSSSALVVVTSGRGRGKSAALGLGLAAAFETGLPNLYVTAPSPENLSTLMQFVVNGLNAFQYEEHQDYTVSRSMNPEHNQAVVRIDVYRQNHRQSLIYLPPWELAALSSIRQADLVCIDEAAAIPLPIVQSLISGPRFVFMASTVNGYEGTGRSLSFKLLRQLRCQCTLSGTTAQLSASHEGSQSLEKQQKLLGRGFRSVDTSRVLYEFCDANFGELSGARIVRIATHPDYQGLGYGTRALKLLYEYYSNQMDLKVSEKELINRYDEQMDCNNSGGTTNSLSRNPAKLKSASSAFHCDAKRTNNTDQDDSESSFESNDISLCEKNDSKLLTEVIKRREPTSLPPLLSRLNERPCEKLDYVGVSFGATPSLLRFWKRSGYVPVYLRQSVNELTGEFTCIMLKPIRNQPISYRSPEWFQNYFDDFTKRLIYLFPGPFRNLDGTYGLELLSHKILETSLSQELTQAEIKNLFSAVDLERLRRYSRSLIDFHLVNDLLPLLAQVYFQRRLPNVRLNKTQQVILLGMGLQHKTVERLSSEFDRLLGDSACPQIRVSGLARSDDAVYSVLNSLEEKGDSSACKVNSDSFANKKKGPDTGIHTGWAKRILGLLFVIVRELTKSLDAILESKSSSAVESRKNAVNGRVQPVVEVDLKDGNYTALRMDEDAFSASDTENSDKCEDSQSRILSNDEDSENDSVDEEKNPTSHNLGVQSEISDSERERRSTLVRQLISEELVGQSSSLGPLSAYKIRGSETDWAEAVVGHGSDLSSLTVKLPDNQKVTNKIKSKRECPSGHFEKKKHKKKPKLTKSKRQKLT